MDEIKLAQAEHMRSFLKAQRITQEKLADELGVSVQSMSRWVNGQVRMSDKNAEKLSEKYPEYPAPWFQGAPSLGEMLQGANSTMRSLLEGLRQRRDAFLTIIDAVGYEVEHIPNGGDVCQILPDGNEKLIASGYSIRLTAGGKECLLDAREMDSLQDEVFCYVEMRLDAICRFQKHGMYRPKF